MAFYVQSTAIIQFLTIHRPQVVSPGVDPNTGGGRPGHIRHTESVYLGHAFPHRHNMHSVYTSSWGCLYRCHSPAYWFLQVNISCISSHH